MFHIYDVQYNMYNMCNVYFYVLALLIMYPHKIKIKALQALHDAPPLR